MKSIPLFDRLDFFRGARDACINPVGSRHRMLEEQAALHLIQVKSTAALQRNPRVMDG
jgi:hypothetical protein